MAQHVVRTVIDRDRESAEWLAARGNVNMFGQASREAWVVACMEIIAAAREDGRRKAAKIAWAAYERAGGRGGPTIGEKYWRRAQAEEIAEAIETWKVWTEIKLPDDPT